MAFFSHFHPGAYNLLKPAKKKNPHKRAGEKKQIENAANHFLNLI